MHVELITPTGSALRQILHNGQSYVEAPPSGEYEIRLTNTSGSRRLAVVSVDGINVIDGKDAGVEGSGYVLGPFQSTTIKGFLRGSSECARFTFAESGGSYAAQTGRGKKNTGVIGVAVFDEKVKPPVFTPPIIIEKEVHHHHWPRPWEFIYGTSTTTTTRGYNGSTFDVNCSTESLQEETFSCSLNGEDDGMETPRGRGGAAQRRSAKGTFMSSKGVQMNAAAAPDLGTAYGRSEAFYTSTTTFERASTAPVLMLTLRYGVTAKLREWGVPVDVAAPPMAPNPFPASPGYAPPPPGWRG